MKSAMSEGLKEKKEEQLNRSLLDAALSLFRTVDSLLSVALAAITTAARAAHTATRGRTAIATAAIAVSAPTRTGVATRRAASATAAAVTARAAIGATAIAASTTAAIRTAGITAAA